MKVLFRCQTSNMKSAVSLHILWNAEKIVRQFVSRVVDSSSQARCACIRCQLLAILENLDSILSGYKEGTLNMSKLAAVDMPARSGKKGSCRKASQKKSTKAIKNILEESIGSHTYRVNPASCSSDPLLFSLASQVDHFQASSDDMVFAYDDT